MRGPLDTPSHPGANPFVLAVASGKGGTGKTLVATNLAVLEARAGRDVVLADCDVEAPNDALFLPAATPACVVVETLVAEVDPAACTGCGLCRDACAFGAVRVLGGTALVFEEMCHGCGACVDVCPEGAMRESLRRVGEVATGAVAGHPGLTLASGTLDIGEVKTPTVIRSVRRAAATGAHDLAVLDAPPGVACSAVAAVNGADALLLVTEPTVFGVHDLRLGLSLGRTLGLPMAVVVNRDGTGRFDVDALCAEWEVPIVARIPFDRRIAEVYATGGLVADALPDIAALLAPIADAMRGIAQAEVAR
jgi:MinD superfamily P-loop ATPase